jgi:hypothetical protein
MSRVQYALQHGSKALKTTTGSLKKNNPPLCPIGLILPVLVLVCLLPVSAAADQLGRLFFSAEERAALEALRSGTDQQTMPPPVEVVVPPTTSEIAATDLYSLGGLITRQSELQAVWLNEQRYALPSLPENISHDQSLGREEILFQVPQRTESYPLRPGQRLDLNNHRVWEIYERGWQSALPLPEEGAAEEEQAEPQTPLQATSE